MYWTDGQTDRLFLHENPQFLGAKGTTKKAEALELFVYPNWMPKASQEHHEHQKDGWCYTEAGDWS